MMDRDIPWIGLAMRLDSLDKLSEYVLPPGYGFRYFQPGDERLWAKIETSAGEFPDTDSAIVGFRRYYPSNDLLDERMIFLTEDGTPFATATAWYGDGGPCAPQGRLHWVGIDLAHQRRRLSYPLVSLALARLRALGHTSAYLTTQTSSWPAIKVYYRFGFEPMQYSEKDSEGWRIVSDKTGIDFNHF